MTPLPEGLARWLEAGGLSFALRASAAAFFLCCAGAAFLLARARSGGKAGRPGLATLMAFATGLGFAGLWTYQGTWQLAGFARPGFVDFMRRYNRRPDAVSGRIERGRIVDANGVVLAEETNGPPRTRTYPLGREFGHVVGYASLTYGFAGLEAADDASLSGASLESPGDLRRFGLNVVNRARARGADLELTLDARLQSAATGLMRGRTGAVLALRPEDGAVLALVSAPAFDANDLDAAFAAGTDDGSPVFNRALHGLYPPGSVFKILVAGAALEADFKGRFACPAEGYAPERGVRPVRDHEYYAALREGRTWGGHGAMDLGAAFRKSSNVFFAQLAVQLGADRLAALADRAGLGRPVVLFDGSSGRMASKPGLVPDRQWRERRGELAQAGFGQGRLLVTPMHVAVLVGAVARGGVPCAPRLARRQPVTEGPRLFEAATAAGLRKLMRDAVVSGTGRPADVPGLEVAGKTGTAQNPQGEDHSWFACLAPASAPRLAVVVLVEHGGYGSEAAAPVAARLLERAKEIGLFDADGGKDGVP